jgi:class 3 adenylate cyclase/predicted ATPase
LPSVSTESRDTVPGSLAGERKLVTVLLCALANAAKLSKMLEPEAWYEVRQRLFSTAQQVLQRYEGTIQHYREDGFLALFGAPLAHEDHAQRAALAALDLQERVRQRHADLGSLPEETLALRLALHTGEVVVGRIGDDPHPIALALGETTQLAERLLPLAEPGTTVLSEATRRRLHGTVRVEAVGHIAGLEPDHLAPAFRVLGLGIQSQSWQRGRTLSPFVGREREMAALQAVLAQAEEGRGHVVGILGEPGMGKSRLLYEFRRLTTARPLTYLAGGWVSYGHATPYLPLRQVVRHAWGIADIESPERIAVQVQHGLQDVGMPPDDWAPHFLQLLGVEAGTERLAELSPQVRRTRTFEALLQLCLHVSWRQPLVLEIENLHWIDPTSEAWLALLVERLPGVAMLPLVTYRPGYRPPWIDKSYVTQLALLRLTSGEGQQIVNAVLHPRQIPDALGQEILAKADGNPLFLEELAWSVRDHGDGQSLAMIPETLQAVLAARIDRLPAAAKYMLQVAAVIGKEGPLPLLQAGAALPDETYHQGLARLQAAEFLYEVTPGATGAYAFKHALTQEVAYNSLLANARQQLHARLAQLLAARWPETVEAQPELLARHYTAAGLTDQAISYWQRAGQRALERSANLEAVHHLTKGLVLLATRPETPARTQQELDLQLALGPGLMAIRGPAAPEVEQTYARARVLCAQLGETPELFPTLRGLCRFYQYRGALPTAWEMGEQLFRLAQRTAAPAHLLEAHEALGSTSFFLGDYAAARTHLEQGIALTDLTQQRALVFRHGFATGVRCLAYVALTLWCLGYPVQALRRSREALALAQALAHPTSLAPAQHWAALLHHHRRETPGVQAQADALLTLATAQGFPLYVGYGTCWHGWALAMQDQGEAGLTQLRQGMTAVLATGQTLSRPLCLVLLAEAAGRVGQVEEGLRLLAEALAAFEASARGDLLAEAYRLQGVLMLQQAVSEAAQAEACFQQALDIARCQQAKSWELRAATSLARLWHRQGKRDEARELLAPIYSWFTEGFDTADLQEVKALVDELSRPGIAAACCHK